MSEQTLYRERLKLWYAFTAPAVAFFANLQVNYSLVPVACGMNRSFILYCTAAGAVVLAVSGAACGALIYRAHRDDRQIKFIAATSAVLGILFTAAIAAQGMPITLFNPCER